MMRALTLGERSSGFQSLLPTPIVFFNFFNPVTLKANYRELRLLPHVCELKGPELSVCLKVLV